MTEKCNHGFYSPCYQCEEESLEALETIKQPRDDVVMTDKELIEYAAKANGCLIHIDDIGWIFEDENGNRGNWWNPLEDDGDALRLAVQLSLEIYFEGEDKESSVAVGYHVSLERPCKIKYVIEFHDGDIFKSTRRAIVRAAAEIGKSTE